MSPTVATLFVFLCAFGAALLGMFVRRLLPASHLSAEYKDVVRVAMGLVATTAA